MKRSVVYFILLTFAISWPFGLYGYGWFDGSQILYRYIFASLFMMGPAVAAFVVRFFIEKKDFRGIGFKIGNYKLYILVLFMFLLRFTAPALLDFTTGNAIIREDITSQMQTVIVLSLLVGIIPAFGEEFGWRGYLLPRLLEDNDKMSALVVVGIVWGIWHFPIALGGWLKMGFDFGWGSPEFAAQLLPTVIECASMIGAGIAMSIIFGSLWLKSQSILLVSFAHAWHNAARDVTSLVFVGVSLGSTILGGLVFILIVLGCWQWVNKNTLGAKLIRF